MAVIVRVERVKVHTVVILKIIVFGEVTPYNLAEIYCSFGEKFCLHVQGSNSEYTASHSTRRYCSQRSGRSQRTAVEHANI